MFHPRSRPFLTLSIFCAAAVSGVAADPPAAPQDSKHTTPAPAAKVPKPQPGAVVFVDPATGQIRQPTASEIGDLSPSPNPVAPKAPEPSLMQGPGGSVGAKLGEDSLTYMVVTAAPDGKLAMDCVTGSKAADAQVRTPAPPSKPTRPQDTHDVKAPR